MEDEERTGSVAKETGGLCNGALSLGQSEKAAPEARSAEDYISQKPRGLLLVFLLALRWTIPTWGSQEGYVFAGSARPSRAREMLPAPPLTG